MKKEEAVGELLEETAQLLEDLYQGGFSTVSEGVERELDGMPFTAADAAIGAVSCRKTPDAGGGARPASGICHGLHLCRDGKSAQCP